MSDSFMFDDRTVLVLTKDGERELREPGTALKPEALQALVLVDGLATVGQILKHAGKAAPDSLKDSLNALLRAGFVTFSRGAGDALDPGDFFTWPAAPADGSGLGEQAQHEADSNTDFLRRNGYYVNMARRPAVPMERGAKTVTVLVVDDDPDICKLLRLYLKLEGIEAQTAGNRDEIIAALRRAPLPDLVLLDVQLPDANGFDVLAKMRQHPILKDMPVIMLTASATREAVLKGIANGANGYVTKPFQIHPLLRAVKAVLGLKGDSANSQDWDYSL